MNDAPRDPVELIDQLDADAIRAELDTLYSREAALRAALKVARQRERMRVAVKRLAKGMHEARARRCATSAKPDEGGRDD